MSEPMSAKASPPDGTGRIIALASLDGPMGGEGPVADALARALGPHVDRVERDALGNVIAVRRARPAAGDDAAAAGRPTPTLVLTARLDEPTLIVARLDAGGFLRFRPLGPVAAFDARAWLGQPVTVHGRRPLPGVIGTRPPHVLDAASRDATPDIDALFVDVGLAEDDVRAAVAVGDAITVRRAPAALAGGRLSGKAVASRAALAALIEIAAQLDGTRHECTIVFAGTAQGGFGQRGAVTLAGWLADDESVGDGDSEGVGVGVGSGGGMFAAGGTMPRRCAIAFGVTTAQQRGVEASPTVGGGPVLGRGPIVHPVLHAALVAEARRLEAPHQIEVLTGPAASDAGVLQVTAGGTPCAAIGIPTRYAGTAVETIAVSDVARAVRLVVAFAASLDADGLAELRPALPNDAGSAGSADAARTTAPSSVAADPETGR